MYEIPSASSSDHGLEGFSTAVGGTRVGRVAAVNSGGGGPLLVVDMGTDYRALPATTIEQIDTVNRAITLTTDGEAALGAAPPIEPDVQRAHTPHLLRHIPREFDRFLVEVERVATRPSRLWYVGAPLLLLGEIVSSLTIRFRVAPLPLDFNRPNDLFATLLGYEKPRRSGGFHEVGGTGLEPVTPSLSSWCSPN